MSTTTKPKARTAPASTPEAAPPAGNVFLDMHVLRSFPASNLNRGEEGDPKTIGVGGSARLRVSSQCWRRSLRTSDEFRAGFAGDQLGVRTAQLPQMIGELLPEFPAEAKKGLDALLMSLGKKGGATGAETGDEEDADLVEEAAAAAPEEAPGEARTAHLLYVSKTEVAHVAEFARQHQDELAKLIAKGKLDQPAIKALRGVLAAELEQRTDRNAADVGLFGRFVTSNEFDTIEAAASVGHMLGVQRADLVTDYFTALDDRTQKAGMIGESDLAAPILYGYLSVDFRQLERNLGARSPKGRVADAAARALARQAMGPLLRAVAYATPRGKKSGTAPFTRPEYVEVAVRRGQPLSYAAAFTKPVNAGEGGGDAMAGAIARLCRRRDRDEEAFGDAEGVLHRLVLCTNDELPQPVSLGGAKGRVVKTLAEMVEALSAALEAA